MAVDTLRIASHVNSPRRSTCYCPACRAEARTLEEALRVFLAGLPRREPRQLGGREVFGNWAWKPRAARP